MYQPNYSVFSKKRQRTLHNSHNASNKPKYHYDAEKWFKERKSVVPPGLSNNISCKLCSKKVNMIKLDCCQTSCFECFSFNAYLYNRCGVCKKILDEDLYEQYDGLDITIPSYDDFIFF
jgi:hypothetical protein